MERIKKTKSSLDTDFPRAVLYRDDLDHIIHIIQERHGTVRIADDDNVYSSIDEMHLHKGEKVKRLDLSTERGEVKLTIGSLGSRGLNLHSWSPDAVRDTHPQIEEILHRRRSLVGWISKRNFWKYSIVSFILLLFSFGLTRSALVPKVVSNAIIPVCAVCYIVSMFLAILLFPIADGKGTIVYLVRKHESKNFWRDNRDKIVLMLLGAFIAEVARYISTKVASILH